MRGFHRASNFSVSISEAVMITKDLKKLLQKLDDHSTRALEAAAGFCITRTHYEVSLEHLILKLLEDGSGDIPRILAHFGVDSGKFWEALTRKLESFRGGNTGRPTFSPVLLQLIESAWVTGSVHHDLAQIRSGHLLEALLDSEGLRLEEYMDVLAPVRPDELRNNFISIVGGSAEDITSKIAAAKRDMDMPKRDGQSALELYTTDITGNARAGKIDPVFGRDKEIRQIIDILSRRRKNNPILVGEAGVGKTAVVEGLALRIVEGDVPSSLADVDIRGLDLGLLQAGAGVKGEFENRLKNVITQVRESAKPIILFIDEAHTLIGAGGAAGTSDAANLLKPALARGELRTVAATTWSEYKKYFEKDAALERRFQMVKIDEPSVELATSMLRGIKGKYEAHHGIQISDDAVATTVKLAERFISGRQLPDKAVDLLDTSAARVRMAQTSKPAALDDAERRLQNLDVRITAVKRDLDTGLLADTQALAVLEEERTQVEAKRADLEMRWKKESGLAKKIMDLRHTLQEVMAAPAAPGAKGSNEAGDQIRDDIRKTQLELEEIQGDDPLVHVDVNGSIAAQVVADWTGIPVGSMMKDEVGVLLTFEDKLRERILGQDEALAEIATTIRTAKSGMRNPEAPIGVFLFVGPSGVGKTECARVLADSLFGGERFVITINMSEYQESHTVSQLKGSPPGYVGYGEGGVLTEAVRQRPYSVVLLDEVEKAHRDVLNLFYQVFDRGFMRDGEGREIDFKNTVIMMTSNLGSDTFMQVCTEDERPTTDQLREVIHQELVNHFQAALLARMKVIPFYPLRKQAMKGIVKLKLGQIGKRLRESHAMDFGYDQVVADTIIERCTQIDTGARNIDFIIDRTVLPDVAKAMLAKMAEEKMPSRLTLGMDEKGNFIYSFTTGEATHAAGVVTQSEESHEHA
jgi:type VI secretion system protein VasG